MFLNNIIYYYIYEYKKISIKYYNFQYLKTIINNKFILKYNFYFLKYSYSGK